MVVNNTVSTGLHPFFCFSPLSFGEGMRDWFSMMRLMNSISMLGGRRYPDLDRNEFYVMIIAYLLALSSKRKTATVLSKNRLWRALSGSHKQKEKSFYVDWQLTAFSSLNVTIQSSLTSVFISLSPPNQYCALIDEDVAVVSHPTNIVSFNIATVFSYNGNIFVDECAVSQRKKETQYKSNTYYYTDNAEGIT